MIISSKKYLEFKSHVFTILEKNDGSNKISKNCDYLIIAFIILNIIIIICESIDKIFQGNEEIFRNLEIFFVLLFTFEYLLRLWSQQDFEKNGKIKNGRIRYFFSFYGLVDILSVLPFYLQIIFPGFDLRILRTFRLIRILKISHYNSAIEDLFQAIYVERKPFLATLYIFAVAILLNSTLLYFAESQVQPDKFGSIPDAIYWSVITLTTVGYGDVTPQTSIGKVIAVFTALTGICVVALLSGIVATAFSRQINQRQLIFEEQVRKALEDGVITDTEMEMLNTMRKEFDIDDEFQSSLIKNILRQRSHKYR
ncbi:MAG: potassium channel protein [Rhodospirillaceae bacterium]|nr:potassium channel protein [Rhodospirillaceae bacterium]|tara:strand:+ start:740 stop:1672 length:933 start_codon:yes stop_codon:yes gene_type:complete